MPLAARITALCDVYDAITSDRVYKKAWGHQEAADLIRNGSEIHFDPVIPDIFLKKHTEFAAIKEKYSGQINFNTCIHGLMYYTLKGNMGVKL